MACAYTLFFVFFHKLVTSLKPITYELVDEFKIMTDDLTDVLGDRF